ncbi:MAG TPA: ABC transporter substrate-binding protein [Terrimesophilobacter sp.]|nr:ABC transporter substrate-binding protein [Terrimesophilobacter sp.]
MNRQNYGRSRRALRSTCAMLATAALVAALAACTPQQAATGLDKDADVTLTVWTGQAGEAQEILESLAKEFMADHENVTLELSAGASSTPELLQKLSAGFAGGTYPDMSYAFGSWASQLERSGRTLDIREQVKDPDVAWDEFAGSARATVQPTGEKVIGFPAVVDNLSLIYNKTVFDAAGVDYPDENWSWDDFREAAAELTDASTETYGYAYSVSGSEATTWQFWPHLWQNGGAILSDDGTKAEFDSDAGVKALTFLRDMAVQDKSVYLDQTDTKIGPLFQGDRIGMMTSGPWELYGLQQAGTDYGVTILPGTNGDHQTVSGPDIWALFDHKDPNRAYWAYTFAEWLTSAAQDERFSVALGNLPLRSSSVGSAAYQERAASSPGYEIMAANAENAKQARPTVPGYVGLSEAIGQAISEVLQGQGDPADALKKAADEADKALSDG